VIRQESRKTVGKPPTLGSHLSAHCVPAGLAFHRFGMVCARRLVDGLVRRQGDGTRGGGGWAHGVMAIATKTDRGVA